jgi:Skp1 family, dimerisation domain
MQHLNRCHERSASCHCSLEMKPLVDLTSRALARMIEGKTPEEIRATFKLPDDLTEEEKLEPLKSGLADARIKLLNKLYAKKRQASITLVLVERVPS